MLHESGARSDVTLSCASAIEPSRTEVELYGRERSIAVDARAAARAESFARLRAEFADGGAYRRTPSVRRGTRARAPTARRPRSSAPWRSPRRDRRRCVVLLALAAAGAAIGIRHLYLRLDRPGGIDVLAARRPRARARDSARGSTPATPGPQMQDLLWRRLAWPGPGGRRSPSPRSGSTASGRPCRGERWRVPASFSIVPVELDDGVVLELAAPAPACPQGRSA